MLHSWRTFFVIVVLLAVFAAPARAAEGPPEGAKKDEPSPPAAPKFIEQVAPILTKYCVGCHGVEEPESGLVLETYQGLLKGGEHGPALIAGDSEKSRLLMVLTGKAKPSMPPEGSEGPSSDEIAILAAWIKAGAKGPSGAAALPRRLNVPAIAPIDSSPRDPIFSAAYSPDGKQVALGQYRRVRLISVESRATQKQLDDHAGAVNDVRFSRDGKLLLAASGEPGLFGEVVLWNFPQGSRQGRLQGHGDSLYAAAISPDGRLVATAAYDHDIRLWDVQSGQNVVTMSGHNGAVFDLAFRPDGKVLASASADHTAKLWDVATGRRLDTLGESTKELYCLAFSPDGGRLAAAGVDNRIRLWRISQSAAEGTNPLIVARIGHLGAIIELVWSKDGKTLVSAAEDRTVKIWNAENVTQRFRLEPQPDWPTALAISPDGKQLCVGRLDGSVAFYSVSTGKIAPPPKPQLATLEPRAIQRGKSVRVLLKGKYLLDAERIETNDKRLTAKLLPPPEKKWPDAKRAWIELVSTDDLPRGTYELAVLTSGGKSEPLKIEVDDLAQLFETEPNNTAEAAGKLPVPCGVWGVVQAAGDVDDYSFTATAGQCVVAELTAAAMGSKLDGVLTLHDSRGRVVATSNDFDGRRDPLLAYQVPQDGAYRIEVSSLTLKGGSDHHYRLTVGEFPYVTGAYPLSVPANAETQLTLTGYNLPDNARISVKAGASGELSVPIKDPRYRGASQVKVLVGTLGESREQEPNDTLDTATRVAVSSAINGRIFSRDDRVADVDFYRFEASAGQTLILETEAAPRGSPVDTKIEVLSSEGRPVERLLLQAVRDSWISFRGIDSDTRDVRVANWEEMELNELLYFQGEVCKIFRLRRGPDSGFLLYGWGGKRIGYFGTSPTTHALDEPCYVVQPHPPGSTVLANGLPVFPLYYANDDDGHRKDGRDSRLTFTAPAAGDYLVRVTDVRGMGGDRFAYRLTIRQPHPDFKVTVGGANPKVHAGGGQDITFTVDRIDGFDGPVTVDVEGLPPGFEISTPVVIEAGHFQASAVLLAAADASPPAGDKSNATKVTVRAEISGSPVVKSAGSLGRITLADKGKLRVWIEPREITLVPGKSVPVMLKVQRNGLKSPIRFEVFNLPHGVIVDNIGLNGVLIPEGQTERQIFLSCRAWVPETTRQVHAVAISAGKESSPPAKLHIRQSDTVARAPDDRQP